MNNILLLVVMSGLGVFLTACTSGESKTNAFFPAGIVLDAELLKKQPGIQLDPKDPTTVLIKIKLHGEKQYFEKLSGECALTGNISNDFSTKRVSFMFSKVSCRDATLTAKGSVVDAKDKIAGIGYTLDKNSSTGGYDMKFDQKIKLVFLENGTLKEGK